MALVYNLLFTTCVIAAVRSTTVCPSWCNCTSSALSVSVNCKDGSLTSVPIDLPKNTSFVDLTGNPVKCDCEFYRSWKILKGKGVEIRGRCSDSSSKLSGASFQDLKEESFACDGSSVLLGTNIQPSTAAAANVVTSPPVRASEKIPAVTPEHGGDKSIESSQPVDVIALSQNIHAVASPQAVPVVMTTRQIAPVVTQSYAMSVETSSLAVNVGTSHKEAFVAMSSKAVPEVPTMTSSRASAVGKSSQALPVIPGQQRSVVTSVAELTSSTGVHSRSALLPSSSAAKLEMVTTTRTPRMFHVSTTVALEFPPSSSVREDGSSSVAGAPPLGSASVQVNVTSSADVSPAEVSGVSSSTAAPPTMPPETPVITTLEAPSEPVGLYTMVQVKCVSTGNPKPNVRVTFNGQPAEKADGVNVRSGDSGKEIEFKAVRNSEVSCEASSELGRDKRKIKISVDQTGAEYLMLRVELTQEQFNENMKSKDSKEFQDIAEKVTSQVRSLVSQYDSFVDVSLVELRKGSVIAYILVKTFQDSDDSVEKTLKAEIEKAKLGSIPVDRYKYSFERTQACPSEFLNVTWNNAAHGETDVVPCPRGSQGFAKRNCSLGEWYYPDYTDCKSDEFVSLRSQMKQSTSLAKTADAFLTGLENLLNLTTPNEDYAIMAGDLASSTEILQIVVDYIKQQKDDHAHDESEVKLVVEVASNVLHRNNEQEFIVAQKLKQTASKFILLLEEYGRQAARVMPPKVNRDLAIIKTENVVMGAGVADPKTVSEDITFPNYAWSELADVQKKWNTSTFVVLKQDMIKSMDDDNNGIRISGFLYRTLTRILSFESAYSDKGHAFEINSAVISASMNPKPSSKLAQPVVIASKNLQEVDLEDDEEPICAFWDFNMNAPHGGWSKEGCNVSSYNRIQTTCQCDHMTNFAVLRSKPLPPVKQVSTQGLRDFIHCVYIASWIIIAFAVLTFLILLILCPWLEPDRTWAMHMCVCASVIVTFVLILLGLASYNNLNLCHIYSFLVHYFFLCTFSWILTEGVYMRTWITEKGPRKRYWIIYFLLGWGLPGIAMFITWLINKLVDFESFMSCWLSISNPLVWVFFVPAVVFFFVSCFNFIIIWRAITGLPRQGLKNYYRNTRFRVRIRYSLILMLMFIITWLMGILLITYYWKALLCILFIICCTITGFMLLLFYVIMDRQVQDAFKYCCCCWRKGRRGSYWVKGRGGDVFKASPQEDLERREQERQQERQRLVSEGTEQTEQDQDIELNGVDKTHEYEDPLIPQDKGPRLEPSRPFESSTESFDPLYERVRHSAAVEVPPSPSPSMEEPKPEPVYSKVIKPKRPRHPESDSDDDDELLTPEEREARWMRGLTREQVIRMAKKSDASKTVLKRYESPTGSKEKLGGPVYLMNQQELDEELKQFRKFFDHGKTPESSSTSKPTTSTPRTDEISDSPSGTFKRDAESTSSSVAKPASKPSVSWEEDSAAKKAGSPGRPNQTGIDTSLQELDRRHRDERDDPTDKRTDV